jgi:hypothetical protein
MDDFQRALLHGTSGLRAAEEAMDGDLGAALRDQAISEWASQPQAQRTYRPAGPMPRWQIWLAVIAGIALALVILIH